MWQQYGCQQHDHITTQALRENCCLGDHVSLLENSLAGNQKPQAPCCSFSAPAFWDGGGVQDLGVGHWESEIQT